MLEQLASDSLSLDIYQWCTSSVTIYGTAVHSIRPYSLEDLPIGHLKRSARLTQKALLLQEANERRIVMEAIEKEERERKKKKDNERAAFRLKNFPPLTKITPLCHTTAHGPKLRDRYNHIDSTRGSQYIRCASNAVNHKVDYFDVGK
jgi:hypothetical protein